ncbi:MAG: dephospho-CoA kinase [Acidimicrobiales bacterium]
MSVVIVSGGIGAGKSTVGAYLEERGYRVVDADVAAREVAWPGGPVWTAIVDAFGSAALARDGTLDRAFLAGVVFGNDAARARLEAITHPAILQRLRQQLDAVEAPWAFAAVPLYRPELRELLGAAVVWVVVADPAVALERLVTARAMSEEDARARLAAQVGNDVRTAWADVVIANDGSLDELRAAVDRALAELGDA